jgi:hypothetical protein
MLEAKQKKNILFFSLPLGFCVAIASYFGICVEITYSLDNPYFAVQGIGQDIINLFVVVPVLWLTAVFIFRSNNKALFIWSGTVIYIIYSYVLYCFAVHFNFLFLVYCAILGLSVYALLYYTHILSRFNIVDCFDEKTPIKSISIYLQVVAVLFYIIWLGEIIPALFQNETPKSITESGLLTNPVHVMDIAIVLPALFIVAVALRRGKAAGFVFAPAFLVFCLLMALAIGGMIVLMKIKGFETDVSIAVVFAILTVISLIFVVWLLRHLKK